jgi:hypothetical protein
MIQEQQSKRDQLPKLVLKKDKINFDPKSISEVRSSEKFKQLRHYQDMKKQQQQNNNNNNI